jgi:thiol-disulfide isomerase/thioredoxin
MPRSLSALPLLLFLLVPIAKADQPSLPGCEAPAALRKTLKDQLESKEFRHLDFQPREERQQRVLSELFTKYPREMAAYRRWISEAQLRSQYRSDPEPLAAIQKQLREREAAHPEDPLALDLYASALLGTDTPESIRMLEKAQTLAPGFAWPSLDLAQIYSSGKFADKSKFTDQLTKFWTACPTSQDPYARWMLVKVPELQAPVAKAERAALEKETDPERLRDYEFLWGLEFRTTSPQKFPELRQRVAADVKRLEQIRYPNPDAEWANLLIQGNRQSGAIPESIAASEDALLAKYPRSEKAYNIISKRWIKAHPEPEGKDVAAWKTYRPDQLAMLGQWIQDFPDAHYPPEIFRYAFLSWNNDGLSEAQGIAMIDAYLKVSLRQEGPTAEADSDENAANTLLDHHWDPARALALLQRSRELELDRRSKMKHLQRDDPADSELKDQATSMAKYDRDYAGPILMAAMRAHRPDAVTPAIKASVEAPRVADDKDESAYWLRRARLAAIEGQQQDALGYYQLALRTRPKPPSYERGKLTDVLADEAHALWKERGGSEIAWAAWSAPGTTLNSANADDARWEKPTKTLPTFELADLSGRTWSGKSLNGKVVLINLWATWCGPCNAELPQLQKLYEQAKGRSDLQILTFNIDEDLGLVEPFMKEKGYTFPVVPAYSYVVNLLDGYAIPQNWVLSPKGQWEWTQVGYGSDDAWVKDMLAKLDAVRAGG